MNAAHGNGMIIIIRHGRTDQNAAHVLQGRSDYPLNAEGRRQAREAGQKLRGRGIHYDRVFSSPLKRAVQTAEIIVPGAEILLDERLIEMGFGPYEGTDLHNLPPELRAFFSDLVHTPPPKGMERLSSVVERVGEFLEEIKDLPGNSFLFTHGIALKGALEYLTPDSEGRWWRKDIGNCAAYGVEIKNGRFELPQEIITGIQ